MTVEFVIKATHPFSAGPAITGTFGGTTKGIAKVVEKKG